MVIRPTWRESENVQKKGILTLCCGLIDVLLICGNAYFNKLKIQIKKT